MWERVLLAAVVNGTQRHFYVLRKDCSLYQHTFWDSDDNWSDGAMKAMQQSGDGDVIALRSPFYLATGNTFRINTSELYALTHRLSATSRCVLDATEYLTERDVETIKGIR